MLPQHEHWFPTFLVQLLEQDERSFVQTQATLLVAMHDVQSVLSPVGGDVIFFKRDGKNFVAGIVDGNAKGFEDFDLGVGNARVAGRCAGRRCSDAASGGV